MKHGRRKRAQERALSKNRRNTYKRGKKGTPFLHGTASIQSVDK
jgi:hypothetical protein